jgi:hypothetical protein
MPAHCYFLVFILAVGDINIDGHVPGHFFLYVHIKGRGEFELVTSTL